MRRKSLILFIITAVVVAAGLVGIGSPGAGIPVLTYHHIGMGTEWYNVQPTDFEQQLSYLRESGYVSVSVTELAEGLAGRAKLPPRPVVITFDDGYEDNYLAALPVLERQKMMGTFFVVTGKLGQPGYMSWDQAREMAARGMELGSHTVHHYTLNEISLREMERELILSRLMLETNIPASAPIFANPFGETAPAVVKLLEQTGYRAACSSVVGLNRTGENLYMIRRLSVPQPRLGLLDFRLRLWWLNMMDRLGL